MREYLAHVQDKGSQLVALALAGAPLEGPDLRWLDLRAGPGARRRCSARWRRQPSDVPELVRLQRELLLAALQQVGTARTCSSGRTGMAPTPCSARCSGADPLPL